MYIGKQKQTHRKQASGLPMGRRKGGGGRSEYDIQNHLCIK